MVSPSQIKMSTRASGKGGLQNLVDAMVGTGGVGERVRAKYIRKAIDNFGAARNILHLEKCLFPKNPC